MLLIVADDLGYSDIGAFGGEISTPNLDRLATEGRLLTDHHSAPTCSPTRSMIFSGTDHYLAGLGAMAEVTAPNQRGKPGYEGYLNERSLSIAELMQDAGYHTYMAGKWHLGLTEALSPKARGFESSFALLQGGGNHFAPIAGKVQTYDEVGYREDGKLLPTYVENGKTITRLPANFYSTDFYTDKLISYLAKNKGDGKPFFAYAAYTSPHWPLQAPEGFIDRYKGRYDAGYDAIRAARLARQKQLGIIPADFKENPGLPDTPANPKWGSLTAEQKAFEARRMEVYAAMVENLDWNIGRLIAELKKNGQYDNTLIFFQSDNGAEGGDGTRVYPNNANSDNSLANLGKPLSNVSYGRRWAEVGATPFRLWKGNPTEGGVVVPAIARLPRQIGAKAALTQFTSVTDLAPTLLELAKAPDPGSQHKGKTVNPITGVSLLPALDERGKELRAAGAVIADELHGGRYVRRDNWKISWVTPPAGPGRWELFDLATDRGETTDVASANPQVVSELTAEWDAYVQRVGLILPVWQ
ncbi:arylsulfatase [Crenobacter cavernae]|uniref:Arylsulfatase n=1 Tax=Crenobacter cavernae TaxID=2290923 RepID=A0A345Y7P7_9NEIS|nr:arylsulfatase [Crenobacter cavernae]AXK39949.1 arylsulfatase [Crenobacter cavernae]